MRKRVPIWGRSLAWLLSAMAGMAGAQQAEDESTLVRGAFTLDTALGLEVRNDDNIYRSATAPDSATITEFTPQLLFELAPSRHLLSLQYDGAFAAYDGFDADDYQDNTLEASAELLLGQKNRFDLIGGYESLHENRGSGLTEGLDPGSGLLPDEADRYTNGSYLARFTRGLEDDGARLSFEVGKDHLEYDNNKDRTRFFDRDTDFTKVILALPVRGAMAVVVQIDAEDVEYDLAVPGSPSRDSQETRILLGLEFDATAKTTGSLKVGHLKREFDDPSLRSFSSPSWEVALRWSPRTYSHLDVGTERSAEESTSLAGDTTDRTTYSLGWTHEWNDRLSTTFALAVTDEDFLRGDGSLRAQELEEFSIEVAYAMRSWLEWEFALESQSRSSDIDRFAFDGDIARLGIEINF